MTLVLLASLGLRGARAKGGGGGALTPYWCRVDYLEHLRHRMEALREWESAELPSGSGRWSHGGQAIAPPRRTALRPRSTNAPAPPAGNARSGAAPQGAHATAYPPPTPDRTWATAPLPRSRGADVGGGRLRGRPRRQPPHRTLPDCQPAHLAVPAPAPGRAGADRPLEGRWGRPSGPVFRFSLVTLAPNKDNASYARCQPLTPEARGPIGDLTDFAVPEAG